MVLLFILSLDCPNQNYENIVHGVPWSFPVDLHINKRKITMISSMDYNCSLYGYYLDYSGFKVGWKNITDGVFNLTKENDPNKFSIQVTKLVLIQVRVSSKLCMTSFWIAFSYWQESLASQLIVLMAGACMVNRHNRSHISPQFSFLFMNSLFFFSRACLVTR